MKKMLWITKYKLSGIDENVFYLDNKYLEDKLGDNLEKNCIINDINTWKENIIPDFINKKLKFEVIYIEDSLNNKDNIFLEDLIKQFKEILLTNGFILIKSKEINKSTVEEKYVSSIAENIDNLKNITKVGNFMLNDSNYEHAIYSIEKKSLEDINVLRDKSGIYNKNIYNNIANYIVSMYKNVKESAIISFIRNRVF